MWTPELPGKYESLDPENLEDTERHTALSYRTVKQRSVFAEAGHSKNPEIAEHDERSQFFYAAVTRGEHFSRLVAACPDDIIPILRDRAVTKIGEFQTNDVELLKAFEKKKMVAYAFDEEKPESFENTWKSILRHEGRKHLSHDGWHETMTVAVYYVNIKYAANVLGEGILRSLLLKAETGEADDAVPDFPCVRAVIEFKWTHWARKYLIAEFLLYLGWLLCFVGFMTIYIEKNLDKGFRHHMDGGDKTLAILAYALDTGSLMFMCPFFVIEYNAIKHYGWKWLCTWNVLHSLAFVLQLLDLPLNSMLVYGSLVHDLVHQTAILSYFPWAMNPKATFVETLKTLIYNVRYFLLFILLSVIFTSLSFTILYR